MKIKQIHKKKHVIRELKKFSIQECKPVNYYALEKFNVPKWNEAEQEYKTGEIVEHPVNHQRRVKNALKKYGLKGALAYVTAFKKEIPLEAGIGEAVII